MFICTQCQRQSVEGESTHGNTGRPICYKCEGLTEPNIAVHIPIVAATTQDREYRCGYKCGVAGRRGAPPLFNHGKPEEGPWVAGYEAGFGTRKRVKYISEKNKIKQLVTA